MERMKNLEPVDRVKQVELADMELMEPLELQDLTAEVGLELTGKAEAQAMAT
jgi:hypothetical protein